MKKGIYLVANKKSESLCENLVYSIRESGCRLPIRLIHFGGVEVTSPYLLEQVELQRFHEFPEDARQFILNLRSVLTDCPLGYLYRYLAWFSDWDEFIYSDNDIVALDNWDKLFSYLPGYDLVHADEEYTTRGKYNYDKPESVTDLFGPNALESAITAGHIVVRRGNKMVDDINNAVEWFKANPHIPKKHDQSLMHIASLLGKWSMLNLCKPPHNWLSSWAGDYKNALQLIHKIQLGGKNISHIHYSGSTPKGNMPIEDLLLSVYSPNERLKFLSYISFRFFSQYERAKSLFVKIKRRIK